MTDPWEQDPDAWKSNPETSPVAKGKFRFLEMTVAVKPMVPIVLLPKPDDQFLMIKDRDALKLVVNVADGQQALTENDELFCYFAERNLWIRIPWEKC